MSAKEILQNIHYFLGTVLPNAYFAGNWDVDSFHHALHWAEYCEKVYESAVGQPYACKLDSHIRAIGAALENGSSSPVSLEYLKLSSEVLFKALMQNNFIENAIYETVLKKAKDKGCLEKLLQEATEMKAVFVALIAPPTVETSHINVESLSQKLETELHMNGIEDSIIQCSSQKETQDLMLSYLDSTFSDINKMREFLLLVAKGTYDQQSTEKLQEIFINELLQKINRSSILYQPTVSSNVWNQSPSLLSNVAAKSFLFFKCYMDFLVTSVRAMKAHYEGAVVTWQASPGDLETEITFFTVLSHLKHLLSTGEKISAATKSLLLSLVSDPMESPVWHDICDNFLIS